MSFISPSYLHALQVASETELVVAVQVENAAHVLLAELAGFRFNEVKSAADLDSLCDSWLWLLLLLVVVVVLARSEYLKAWVQKRVFGPCESQKWHSAIMAFILCRLMMFVPQKKKILTQKFKLFFVMSDV